MRVPVSMTFSNKIWQFRLLLAALLLAPIALASPPTCAQSPGQESSQELAEAQALTSKHLFLRGLYLASKLEFDGNGLVRGKPKTGSFTLCGVFLENVEQQGGVIEFKGYRTGLTFDSISKQLKEIRLPEKIDIRIADGGNPKTFVTALNTIFADGMDAGILSSMPSYWQHFFDPKLAWSPDDLTNIDIKSFGDSKTMSSSIQAPKLRGGPDPKYNDYAKEMHYEGASVLHLVVDMKGRPRHIAIVKPLGLGLDEEAIAAVQKYRFKPATNNGQPVPVGINIEVFFHIY